MGAAVERLIGHKDMDSVWRVGEDLDLNPQNGLGFRNLANPLEFGFADHYDGKRAHSEVLRFIISTIL
jgi:Zn-dependent metalloprotease